MVWKGHNDFVNLYPELLKEWDFEKNTSIDPSEITSGVTKRVWWKCTKCGHEWQTAVGNRTKNGSGCPKCAVKKRRLSNGKAVRQYTKEGIFIREYPTISSAAEATGAGSISACCKHTLLTSGGYRWEYADGEDLDDKDA